MSISEAERHQLYRRLEEVIGATEANILMEHLPPTGWADVATKRDLDHLETVLRGEMATLSTELRGDMATLSTELRGEMKALSTELRSEMAALSGDLRNEMTGLRADLFGAQRTQVFALLAANTALMGLALALFKLG